MSRARKFLLSLSLQRKLSDAADAEGVEDGILKGLINLTPGRKARHIRRRFRQWQHHPLALRAQKFSAEKYDVSADVWSATSYKNLRNDGILTEPGTCCIRRTPKKPYVPTAFGK